MHEETWYEYIQHKTRHLSNNVFLKIYLCDKKHSTYCLLISPGNLVADCILQAQLEGLKLISVKLKNLFLYMNVKVVQ